MFFLSNTIVYMFSFNYINHFIAYILPNSQHSTRQILLSTSHAMVSSSFSTLYLLNYITQETYIHLIAILLGFALYDIGYIVTIRNRIWKQMLFHHIMIVVSLFPFVYYSITNEFLFPNYCYYTAMNYLVEVSTIPLNISWYLNENDKQDYILLKIASISTLVSYVPFRVINTIYLSFYIFLYEPHTLPFQEIQMIFAILNLFWFFKLCKKAKSIYIKKKD